MSPQITTSSTLSLLAIHLGRHRRCLSLAPLPTPPKPNINTPWPPHHPITVSVIHHCEASTHTISLFGRIPHHPLAHQQLSYKHQSKQTTATSSLPCHSFPAATALLLPLPPVTTAAAAVQCVAGMCTPVSSTSSPPVPAMDRFLMTPVLVVPITAATQKDAWTLPLWIIPWPNPLLLFLLFPL